MNTLTVIDKIDVTFEGPFTLCSEESDAIFLSQGSLDGACGYYSTMMCLIISGVISRDDALNGLTSLLDGRTNMGKLTSRMKSHKFFDGTFDSDIVELFDGVFSKELAVYSNNYTSVSPRSFIVEHLQNNNPVMIAIEWGDGAHWVVAVGMDYVGDSDDKEILRFLILDPAGDIVRCCAWNNLLEAIPNGGQYPYMYHGQGKVKMRDAVAFVAL